MQLSVKIKIKHATFCRPYKDRDKICRKVIKIIDKYKYNDKTCPARYICISKYLQDKHVNIIILLYHYILLNYIRLSKLKPEPNKSLTDFLGHCFEHSLCPFFQQKV